jgi:hypothetical protein
MLACLAPGDHNNGTVSRFLFSDAGARNDIKNQWICSAGLYIYISLFNYIYILVVIIYIYMLYYGDLSMVILWIYHYLNDYIL